MNKYGYSEFNLSPEITTTDAIIEMNSNKLVLSRQLSCNPIKANNDKQLSVG